jgi:hypothetical protein
MGSCHSLAFATASINMRSTIDGWADRDGVMLYLRVRIFFNRSERVKQGICLS